MLEYFVVAYLASIDFLHVNYRKILGSRRS